MFRDVTKSQPVKIQTPATKILKNTSKIKPTKVEFKFYVRKQGNKSAVTIEQTRTNQIQIGANPNHLLFIQLHFKLEQQFSKSFNFTI